MARSGVSFPDEFLVHVMLRQFSIASHNWLIIMLEVRTISTVLMFYRATHAAHASEVLAVVILSDRLFVCLSVTRVLSFVTKPNNALRIPLYRKRRQSL